MDAVSVELQLHIAVRRCLADRHCGSISIRGSEQGSAQMQGSGSCRHEALIWISLMCRFRHYRGYGDKNPLEFDGITDDSMQRYVERLRAALIRYDK